MFPRNWREDQVTGIDPLQKNVGCIVSKSYDQISAEIGKFSDITRVTENRIVSDIDRTLKSSGSALSSTVSKLGKINQQVVPLSNVDADTICDGHT